MKEHIIVIDNDETVQKMLTYCLQRSRYQVTSYSYANATLSNLLMQQPDFIILNLNEVDGGIEWQFLQMLKMEESTATIPILLTATVLQLSAEVQTYLLTQYIRVIHKPFDLNLLLLFIEETLREARQAGAISSNRKHPILVVDDTADLLDATIDILMLEGYQVNSASNGMIALDAVSRGEHCLILLDIAMPIMNGFEFLNAYNRQLRPHSPVIVLSGEKNIETQILPPFVVDVLAKPFEVPHLLNRVERYAQQDMNAYI